MPLAKGLRRLLDDGLVVLLGTEAHLGDGFAVGGIEGFEGGSAPRPAQPAAE